MVDSCARGAIQYVLLTNMWMEGRGFELGSMQISMVWWYSKQPGKVYSYEGFPRPEL